jgi:secondary-alkyl amine dehydrogenase [NAD(P)+]
MSSATSKPRIVIYGVGQYGGYVARFAVEKGWPIVAAFNRAGPKVGQDLGRVVGLERDLGVIVQDCDTGSYDNLDADIGVVAQTNLLRLNMPAYERLMSAGLNVICHGSESYYPYGCDQELAADIDALAKKNGVTFTGSGIWDMSRIWAGVLLAGPCTQIKSLFHSSITDARGQAISNEQARQVGVGLTLDEFREQGLGFSPIATSYKTIPEQVLVTLGYHVTGAETRVEPISYDAPIENPWLKEIIPAGYCVGTRIVAELETSEGVTARAEIELRLFRDGEIEHMFWSVDGKPKTRIRTEREDSAHATAACLFNRIPDVIAASAGIVLITEMGPLKSTAVL